MSVCLNPINFKTAEPIGLEFWVGPHMTSELQKESSKMLDFVKFLKSKKIVIPQKKYYCFIEEKWRKIEQQLKVSIYDWRETP